MATRRGVLAALGASALGGCAAFPRDRAAPTTNLATGPQMHVDVSYDTAGGTLRCVVDMGTPLTPSNTVRLVVSGEGGSDVVWVARDGTAERSFPVEPGDVLEVEWSAPDAYVWWVGPGGGMKNVFGELDAEATSDDA
ncbi:hypothetical protein [Halorubellus litoreus]|uniref:Uncharacterized protein n=1 Tax=Halorubellus litoreus TaxID=755308 RepID=A0ABD5VFV6_9EURY